MQPNQQDDNPYAPSRIAADAKPKKTPRFRPLAVFVGWLADVTFSLVCGIAAGIVIGIMLVAQGAQPERLQEEIQHLTWVDGLGLVLGFCGTVLGGFVAAWMGKVRPLLHAFAVGVASILTGLVGVAWMPDSQPMWATIIAVILTLPAALLGGLFRAGSAAAKE